MNPLQFVLLGLNGATGLITLGSLLAIVLTQAPPATSSSASSLDHASVQRGLPTLSRPHLEPTRVVTDLAVGVMGIWTPDDDTSFPEGPDGPDIAAVRARPTIAECWDAAHGERRYAWLSFHHART